MANIGYWFVELQREIDTLGKMIAQINSSTAQASAINAMLMECDTKINRIR